MVVILVITFLRMVVTLAITLRRMAAIQDISVSMRTVVTPAIMAPTAIHPAPDMAFNVTKASAAISKIEGTDIESWVRTGERPRTSEKDYKHKSAAKLISKEKLRGAGMMVDGSDSRHM